MRVVFFHRKRERSDHYSVEEYFAAVRALLPPAVQPQVAVSPFGSRGLWRRVVNAAYALVRQGDVNHLPGDEQYLTLALRGKRTVLTILDCGFEERPAGLRRAVVRQFWFALPVKRAAAVTVISEFTRGRLLALVDCDASKVHVIPVCISPAFTPSPAPAWPKRPTILQVGTAPNKNVERLIAALSGFDCRLRLIGDLSDTHRRALSEHRIEYTNASHLTLDAMVDEYRRADVVTLVSTYEGFGMPIVEANTIGRPVLTSSVASMPEVAGDAALLVDPLDIGSIRTGLTRLFTEPALRADLVERGFVNARRFDRQAITRQYLKIYEDVNAAARG